MKRMRVNFRKPSSITPSVFRKVQEDPEFAIHDGGWLRADEHIDSKVGMDIRHEHPVFSVMADKFREALSLGSDEQLTRDQWEDASKYHSFMQRESCLFESEGDRKERLGALFNDLCGVPWVRVEVEGSSARPDSAVMFSLAISGSPVSVFPVLREDKTTHGVSSVDPEVQGIAGLIATWARVRLLISLPIVCSSPVFPIAGASAFVRDQHAPVAGYR